MPYTIVMQNWVRIHGSGSSTITIQDQAHWFDIGGFQGLTPWIEVGFFGGSPVLSLETSPTHDEAFFKQMKDAGGNASSWSISAGGLQTVTVAGFPTILSFNWADGLQPPGRWLRWKITGGSNWRAVFRITLTALQGRGGAFQHACIPLPVEARKHDNDHAHAAQEILRARAAEVSSSGLPWRHETDERDDSDGYEGDDWVDDVPAEQPSDAIGGTIEDWLRAAEDGDMGDDHTAPTGVLDDDSAELEAPASAERWSSEWKEAAGARDRGPDEPVRLVAPPGSTIHAALTNPQALLAQITRIGGPSLAEQARAEIERWQRTYTASRGSGRCP